MAWGTITILERDYGVIRPVGQAIAANDLFFHWSDVPGAAAFEQLQLGQHVAFDRGRDERRQRPKATHVRTLPPS